MEYNMLGAGEDLLGDDLLGEDLLGDDELGFRWRRARGPGASGWRADLRRGAPGAPAISEKLLPIGFPGFVFTTSSPTSAQLTVAPQVAFRLERIVASVAKNGASAQSAIVLVRDLKIGANSQLAAGNSIPIDAFAPTAYDTRLACDPSTPGTIIALSIELTNATLSGSDTVAVAVGGFGRAVR
jgi:hypothetical protein